MPRWRGARAVALRTWICSLDEQTKILRLSESATEGLSRNFVRWHVPQRQVVAQHHSTMHAVPVEMPVRAHARSAGVQTR